MRRIYKYELKPLVAQMISIPKLTDDKCFKEQVLDIQVQNNVICMWCLVDTDKQEQKVRIRMFGTGEPADDFCKNNYLGSYQLSGGGFVGHVFFEI